MTLLSELRSTRTVAGGLVTQVATTLPAEAAGTLDYQVDNFFRPKEAKLTVNTAIPVTTTLTPEYDAASSLWKVTAKVATTDTGRVTLTRQEAALGRVTVVTGEGINGTAKHVKETLTYNGFNEPVRHEWTTQAPVTVYEIRGAAGGAPFVRDELGRMSSWTEINNGTTRAYAVSYDANGRLASWTKAGVGTTYSYDKDGNRTGGSGAAGADVISGVVIDAQDRMLSQSRNDGLNCTPTRAYTYTNAGALLTRTTSGNVGGCGVLIGPSAPSLGTETFAYDVAGALRQVVQPAKTIDYVHDALGRRIGKKENGVWTQRLLWDGGRIVGMRDGTKLTRTFVYASKAHVPDLIVDTAGASPKVYRIVTDWRGSVTQVVEVTAGTANPVVAQEMEYDAWGRVLRDVGTLSGANAIHPFGFAGGLYDRDTRLTRFGARDYDADAGRWTAKDPISFDGGWNLYGYCGGDPINRIDPSGLVAELEYAEPAHGDENAFWLSQEGNSAGKGIEYGLYGAGVAVAVGLGVPAAMQASGLSISGSLWTQGNLQGSTWLSLLRSGYGQVVHIGTHRLGIDALKPWVGRKIAGEMAKGQWIRHIGIGRAHIPLSGRALWIALSRWAGGRLFGVMPGANGAADTPEESECQ